MPHRDDPPLARYPLRSSAGYSVALALGVVLTIGGPVALLLAAGDSVTRHPLGLVATALPGLVVLAAYLSSAGAHRVAGGQADVVLHHAHLVVPAAWSRTPLTFSLDALTLARTTIRGRLYGVQVSEVGVLRLSGEGRTRTLSARMFDDPKTLDRLASDIERVRAGGEPEAAAAAAAAPVRPARDRYDDAIDDALSKL